MKSKITELVEDKEEFDDRFEHFLENKKIRFDEMKGKRNG